jgi:cysteine synthase A
MFARLSRSSALLRGSLATSMHCLAGSQSRGLATGVVESVTELIGATPMVRLRRVVGTDDVKVYVKLEMQNPGGSVKDRIALSMIEEAEKRGEIDPSRTTIVEATSGNTGIGLAMVAAAKGYKCIIVMPQVPSMYERYILVRKFGCQVHLTSVLQDDFPKTIANMIGYSRELVANNPDYWTPSQFDTDDNPLAHMSHTGPEIWDQTGGAIDCFVAGAGTGGTLNGAGQFLKSMKPECRVVCVEPTEARVLVGEAGGMHGVVGIGANLQLPLLEKLAPGQAWQEGPRGCIDEFLHASTPEAVQWANKVCAEEGLLVGPSSGAAIKVAVDIAHRPEMKGKTIVVLQASSAIRYVSHPMWEAQKLEGKDALPVPPDLDTEFPICRWRSEDYVPPPKP